MTTSGSQYLLGELRRIRESLGLTQEAWGARINFSAQHVSAVERGTRALLQDYLEAVDRGFGTTFVQFYRLFILGERAPVWLRPFIEYEERATLLRVFQPFVVPGLFQIEAYAREVLNIFDPSSDADAGAAARIARQGILHREYPPHLVAVIDEGALHRLVLTPDVMREQLAALAECAALPHVQIHIIPADTGVYAGLNGGLALATVEGRTVGFLDGYLRGHTIESPEDAAELGCIWERIREHALPARLSIDLIERAAKKWTTT